MDLAEIFDASVDKILVVAGLAFLALTAVASVKWKNLDRAGRIVSGTVGVIILSLGLGMNLGLVPTLFSTAPKTPVPTPVVIASVATSSPSIATAVPPAAATPPISISLPASNPPTVTAVPPTAAATKAAPSPATNWQMNVKDGDKVAQIITLVGDYPADFKDDLWVFVADQGGALHAQILDACQGKGRLVKREGKWEMRIGVGVPTDAGRPFQIMLASAGDQASQSIVDDLKQRCEEDKLHGSGYPGFTRMPLGVSEIRRVNVVRTSDMWGLPPVMSNVRLPGQLSIVGIANDTKVPQSLRLAGSFSPETTDQIWVVVHAPNGRWFPQSTNSGTGVHAIKGEGQWQVPVTFGGDGNAGEPFDVVVMLADARASAFLDAKQKEWDAAREFPGLLAIELPQGIEEKARIRVWRE